MLTIMKKVQRICALLFLAFLLWAGGTYPQVSDGKTADHKITTEDQKDREEAISQGNDKKYPADESAEFSVQYDLITIIMEKGTGGFFEGYPVDEVFFGWLAETYGSRTLEQLAYLLSVGDAGEDLWYELTGRTMHVLWLDYCRAYGYATYLCDSVVWKEAADPECVIIDFVGDINLDERWCMMQVAEQFGGATACIGEKVQRELHSADITVVNNEFTYTETDEALEGKAYTFKTDPANVSLLELFGTDFVSLANNHTYDYGEQGLLDTLEVLETAGIPYGGAGRNLAEASAVRYFVLGGRKIAIVCASEIERYSHYTRAATETSPGVLKTQQEQEVIAAIHEAKAHSDYVIAYIHWGGEGSLDSGADQISLAQTYAQAGVDAVIGGHPHRLQGVSFIGRTSVAYSLGNFWFSDGTLYTTIAQLQIDDRGRLSLRMLPCIQKDGRAELLEGEDAEEFYRYLADVSIDVAIDEEGCISPLREDRTAGIYFSGQNYARRSADRDLEGRPIDIVGNLE